MIHLPCVFAAGSWGNSVYNGPLAQADEFWQSDKTTAAFRDYARAVVARWGASPSVFSWQLFNEMDGALGGTSTAATEWMANMTQHVAPPSPLDAMFPSLSPLSSLILVTRSLYSFTHLLHSLILFYFFILLPSSAHSSDTSRALTPTVTLSTTRSRRRVACR
jgi:hypothetical protein